MSRPTMEDVAREAGVSRALVSLVMRKAPNVSDVRRRAVLDAAARLGYRPNVLARNLASQRTHTIGVVINDFHNPFFAEVLDGIQSGGTECGYRIILGNGCRSKTGEAEAIETLIDYRVDAMIVIGPRLAVDRIVRVAKIIPVVTLGRAVRSKMVMSVNNNEGEGARLAVAHLIGLGHSDIVHIDGGAGAGASPRRAGYIRAMKAAGVGSMARVVRGDFTESSGADAAEQLLRSGRVPTAIFAANDQSAIGAYGVLAARGVAVPGDISLIGYDNISAAASRHLSLTTIDQPRTIMGREALGLAVAAVEGERTSEPHLRVEPTLVLRSTTGSPSPVNR